MLASKAKKSFFAGFSTQDLSREFLAGITTFLTMSYIIVVNPAILAGSGTGMPFAGVVTATVLLAASMSIMMGIYAKLPIAVAPGMGINAFFAYGVVLGSYHVPWQTALGMVFWAGVFFLIASVTPLRVALARAIPAQLRHGVAVGIGLFLTLIGLKNAGLVVQDPTTLVKFGGLHFASLTCLLGVGLIVVLARRKSPLAYLSAMALITLAALGLGKVTAPQAFVAPPDFSLWMAADIWGALSPKYLGVIFFIMFTDLFDSIATFVGLTPATADKKSSTDIPRLKEGLTVDACATFVAGILGTSSGTAYIESAAGMEAGGRTGLTAVVAGLLFLPFLFLSPLCQMVPAYATAPVLIVVGALMFRHVEKINWDKFETAVPAFLVIVLTPLTFSITQGLIWGFISYVALHIAVGKRRELDVGLWFIAAVSALFLWLENA